MAHAAADGRIYREKIGWLEMSKRIGVYKHYYCYWLHALYLYVVEWHSPFLIRHGISNEPDHTQTTTHKHTRRLNIKRRFVG